MSDQRMQFAVEVSLSMLKQWYVTWEQFREIRSWSSRCVAWKSKCRGLVFHDRALRMCAEVING